MTHVIDTKHMLRHNKQICALCRKRVHDMIPLKTVNGMVLTCTHCIFELRKRDLCYVAITTKPIGTYWIMRNAKTITNRKRQRQPQTSTANAQPHNRQPVTVVVLPVGVIILRAMGYHMDKSTRQPHTSG